MKNTKAPAATKARATATAPAFIVTGTEAKAIKAALRTQETAAKKLRSLILAIAERAVKEKAPREQAGRALAEALGLTKLSDDKALSNAWQYVAKQAGLASRKKSGNKTRQKSSSSKAQQGAAATKGIAQLTVLELSEKTPQEIATVLRRSMLDHKLSELIACLAV